MSTMNGRALEFEIINSKDRLAKAIVTKRLDHNELAYIRPNGDVIWTDDPNALLDSAVMRNDMLTIIEHIRLMNGYAA